LKAFHPLAELKRATAVLTGVFKPVVGRLLIEPNPTNRSAEPVFTKTVRVNTNDVTHTGRPSKSLCPLTMNVVDTLVSGIVRITLNPIP
jgi:hypothetical protein